MKIGIVTFQRADNQGALLQCYALHSYLKKLEANTEVIDYRTNHIERIYKIFPLSKNPKFLIKRWMRGIRCYSTLKKRQENFRRLREKICLSPSYTNSQLKQKPLDYDLIFTGSDQVWNTNITCGFDDIFYLNFPGSYVKASYAASLGSTDNPAFQKDYFREKLSAFDGLSVREKDAAAFISETVSKPAVQCVDPTLLLERSEWEMLTKEAEISLPERYVLLYFVQKSPELLKIAEKIAKERNIPVVCLDQNVQLDCETIYHTTAGPIEFVKMIQNAETVVTSSFHATAFSCIFERDIHIIAHSVTGSRVVSLTEMFGVADRIYASLEDFENRYRPEERLTYDRTQYLAQYAQSVKYIDDMIQLAGGASHE